MYGQPPTWMILLVSIALALPSSAIVGLLGWFLYRRLFESAADPSSTANPDETFTRW